MYQQFQNPIASAAKWMFFGFVGIVLMAILLGTDIKNSTWFNPGIAAAQAEQIQMETAHQQEMDQTSRTIDCGPEPSGNSRYSAETGTGECPI